MSRNLVGCSHPSIELRGDTWYCTSCYNPVGKAAYGVCNHPAIQQRSDGGWYCTECQQRVA